MEPSFAEAAQFLLLPLLMCLVLAGIHCYLGFHVLQRGVIFVDLSLAQVAAFGSTLAFMMGLDHDGTGAYLVALASTLVAAGLFSLARKQENRLPQEAIIGIVYALGSAAVILATDKMAHGAEHIKGLLIGQILWVGWGDLLKVMLIYGAVAVVHFVFRKQFFAASEGKASGMWDFFFYALFGVVITSSVKVAGVLQVFAYLIVPSVLANLFYSSLRRRLFFGWAFGFVMSVVGISLSYLLDLPTGAALVVCFTIVPVLTVLVRALRGPSLRSG